MMSTNRPKSTDNSKEYSLEYFDMQSLSHFNPFSFDHHLTHFTEMVTKSLL